MLILTPEQELILKFQLKMNNWKQQPESPQYSRPIVDNPKYIYYYCNDYDDENYSKRMFSPTAQSWDKVIDTLRDQTLWNHCLEINTETKEVLIIFSPQSSKIPQHPQTPK